MTIEIPTEQVSEDDWDRDLEGWDEAETDIGEKITWDEEKTFKGTYRGEITVVNKDGEEVQAHQLVSTDGELRFAWSSPELTTGLRNAGAGSEVAILWMGLVPGRRKGTTMNKFSVRFRRPWEAGSEVKE
jgi:hypothetical protein